MSTTALFVELVIIGLEAMVWIALLISSFFGVNWVFYVGSAFEKASVFLSLALFGVAYLLGILLDEICDSLTEPWAKRIRNSVQEEGQPAMWDMQAYVFSYAKEAVAQLNYMRTRLRILRSSIFNIALISIFAVLFLVKQVSLTSRLGQHVIYFTGITGVIIVALTLFVYWRITLSYWLRTRSIYKSLKENKAEDDNET